MSAPLRVALVSSIGKCGIAEHSDQLRQWVQRADAGIELPGNPDWLDPAAFGLFDPRSYDLVHLNYHRGLHSRWTPEVIARYSPTPFVITFHDTYETQPDTLPWDLLAIDNVRAMVVHEPCDMVSNPKVHYWRQPVPARTGITAPIPRVFAGPWRPTLGTAGFDFPWKNYTMLARVTGALGWNLRIVGEVADGRRLELFARNPRIWFDGYTTTPEAIAALESCDATAFLYDCANSGTSGAIRLGIAAGRPLVATLGCRQFRDLQALDNDGQKFISSTTGIYWTPATDDVLRERLNGDTGLEFGPRGYCLNTLAFANQERWELVGAKYAALYREVAGG